MSLGQDFLDKLGRAEGIKIHLNKGEADITLPYGIYKGAHANTELGDYILSLMEKHGIRGETAKLSSYDITLLNNALDDEVVRVYALRFYKQYLKRYALFDGDFSPALIYPFANIAVNSQKIAVRALQRALKQLGGDLDIDGLYGSATAGILRQYGSDTAMPYLFLCFVKSEYIALALENSSKLGFLKGWDNRVNALLSYL